MILKTPIGDPMSGFFMLRRDIVETVAPRLCRQGFKILLDIVASSPAIRIREIPLGFRSALARPKQARFDRRTRICGAARRQSLRRCDLDAVPGLGLVGSAGVIVDLAALHALLSRGMPFVAAQTAAMAFNYSLNNAFTYRDLRQRGWHFLTGFGMFATLCSVGVVPGVGVSSRLYTGSSRGVGGRPRGAVVGAAWNYLTNSAITWRHDS